jgi:phosphoribosylglycinamide formyltransferase-1
MEKKMRIAVFASGNGTNLQAIIDASTKGDLPAEISLVVSNKADSYALKRANKHNIPAFYISSVDFDNRNNFVNSMKSKLEEERIDFIALAGYMRKIPPEIVTQFQHRITNIHPALLPSFGGKGMYCLRVHRTVLEYGCKVSGVTIHLVDNIFDHGPIIAQQCVQVLENDTPETLAERIMIQEHILYPKVLKWFAEDRVLIHNRHVIIKLE